MSKEYSRRGCQSHNLQVHREVWGTKYFIESVFFCHLLGPWSEVFRFLLEKIQSAYQYCILRVTRRNWKRRKWTLKEELSNSEEKLPPVGQNSSSHVHENSLNGKIFWNYFNFYIYSFSTRKEVRLLSKLIWPSCENCILRVHWKNLRIKNWIQVFSRHWTGSIQFSLENFWQCLSKLHYTCPQNDFRNKKNFLFFIDRKKIYFFLSDIEQECFGLLISFLHGCQISILFFPWNILSIKNFWKKKSSFRFRTWKETFSALCKRHSRRGCQPNSTSS